VALVLRYAARSDRGLIRGYNTFFAEVYGPYRDRMTVGGLISMQTPEEALAELDQGAELEPDHPMIQTFRIQAPL